MATTWRCPRCGRRFANRNQSHACSTGTPADFLAGKPTALVALFHQLVDLAREQGAVTVIAHETKLSLQANTNFAGVTFRRESLLVELLLTRPVDHPRLQTLPPHSNTTVAHLVRIARPAELDAEFKGWLPEADAIGARR